MTNDEASKVAQALQPLDQFASTTPLERNWHGRWQQLFTLVVQQVAAMVDKPAARETVQVEEIADSDTPKT
ncbi:hypothetical protein LCGC14_1491680 [marine sediment metagenome]|uniref:Uncharacterized protein n=1 Tax=marine sediment metagenome TaxID=412755 RepID=A0A0F9KTK5_9ZZZZ